MELEVQEVKETQSEQKITVDELFNGCIRPPKGCIVIEPFVGDGEVLKWIGTDNIVIPYDSDPKFPKVIRRNALVEKPKYYGTYVITRPPQLRKDDSPDKTIFEQFGTDNLYKCFIKCLIAEQPTGGIIVLPLRFLSGTRDSEIKRRQELFNIFKPLRFNVFTYTTVVINFAKRPYSEPFISDIWNFYFQHNTEPYSVLVSKTINKLQSRPYEKPKKSIDCTYIKAAPKGYYKTNLDIQVLDTPTRKMGLYYFEDKDLNEEARFAVRGFISKRLQRKLCDTINGWLNVTRLHQIESLVVPITHLDTDSVIEMIQNTIWHFYTKSSKSSRSSRSNGSSERT